MELEELKGKALRKAKNKKWKETYKPNPTDPRCKWCNGELKYAFISRASTNRRWQVKNPKKMDLIYNEVYRCTKCKKLNKPYSKQIW